MRIKVIFVFISLLIAGCANPFWRYYTDLTEGIDLSKNPLFIVSAGPPTMKIGINPDEDALRMIEDGYGMIGYSSFESRPVTEEYAAWHGESVHASVVLLYSQYLKTVSGSLPMTTPTYQTSTTTVNGSVFGSGGNASFTGMGSTTTYGSRTTYVPYSVDRYSYIATYWVKKKRPIFGTQCRDLTADERKKIGSNKGAMVIAVVKDSPAFHNDVFRGDVLKKVGDKEVYGQETLIQAVTEYAGKTVDVVINRDNIEITKRITMNPEPE